MNARLGRPLLSNPSIQNHFAARYLNLVASTIPDAEQVAIAPRPLPAQQLAAELALRYLTQCGLSQTETTAKTEFVSMIAVEHRYDWPARILNLTRRK
jgi:hypothetical protein